MKSPFRVRGTVVVPTANDGAAARVMAFQLSRSLGPLRARDIEVGEDRVSFRGNVLRVVWGWSLLRPVDSAVVTIRTNGDAVEVAYEFRLVELPVLAFGVSSVMAAPSLIFGEVLTAVTSIVVFCSFFGGINYLLTQWRFQRFLRRVLRRANRRTMPPA